MGRRHESWGVKKNVPTFLDFFENRRNYAISMVHNVFQGHLEVAEHVFDIIFMFHHVFDSV